MTIKKTRAKRSPIWLLPDDAFVTLIQNSKTMSEVLRYFGFKNKGNNFHTVKKRIAALSLTTDHFVSPADFNRLFVATPLDEILVEDSRYNNSWSLKKRLYSADLLEHRCYECNLEPHWNGKPLVLALDHINGVSNDNRLENLRLLCPNCHSQTPTFAGKRFSRAQERRSSGRARRAESLKSRQKQDWDDMDLKALIEEAGSIRALSKRLGNVSDNAIRKQCIRRGVPLPGR